MTRICNFPISETKRCRQPVTGNRPNCGKHGCDLSAQQLGPNPTVYRRGGELHVWTGRPVGLYCMIHRISIYQTAVRSIAKPYCRDVTTRLDLHVTSRHRDDMPTRVGPGGTQFWYSNGELHRDNGPAMICPDGTQKWYHRDTLHREDGPAVIKANGAQYWYQHGRLHREDGPAMIMPDGTLTWHWYGERVTEQEHAELRQQLLG